MTENIRWQQRFNSYQKALQQLEKAVTLSQQRQLSELEQQGLIQAFEYTYETGWHTLKDYLTYQGFADLIGSRDTIRESFQQGLLEDGQSWMNMIADRNRTVHTYNQDTAASIVENILTSYFTSFVALRSKLQHMTSQD